MPEIKRSEKPTPRRAAYVPETATVDYGHEYPRVPVMPPFLYAYNPQRWTFIAGRVVPQLHKAPLAEGHNGVTRAGKRWRLALLKDHMERLGRYPIPWDLGPDGSYLAEVETRTESGEIRTTYLPVWAETYAGSSHIGSDTTGYVEWMESLMDAGHLPRPEPYIIERIASERRQMLSDMLSAQRTAPTESRAQAIANIEDEISQLDGMLQAKPRKAVRKRKASLDTDA